MFRSFAAALSICAIAVAAAATPPKRDEAEKSADSRDKVVCKRFVETGSLVKGSRVCKTKQEWERDREELRGQVSSGACGQAEGARSC